MRLELATFPVREVRLGQATRLDHGVLTVDPGAVASLVGTDENIARVTVDVARPGESARIIHIADVVEPRFNAGVGAVTFPGFLGAPVLAGDGRTHRLRGSAVVTTLDLPPGMNDLGLVKEAILDMSGPGAAFCPFSALQNLVVGLTMKAGVALPDACASWRLAGLKVAHYLGEATRDLTPESVEVFALDGVDEALPRVIYVLPCMTRGETHATYWYGVSVTSTPTLAHPNEILDGALVTGDYFICSHRYPTYIYQHDPVILELYRQHRRQVNFAGVVVCMVLISGQAEKFRQAVQVAKIARMLRVSGAVVTIAQGGHGYADQMLICQALEQSGIKTVLGVDEYGGEDGRGTPLVMSVPEAVAIASMGNQEACVELPPVSRVLGGTRFLPGTTFDTGYSPDPKGPVKLVLRDLLASTCQSGSSRLHVRAY